MIQFKWQESKLKKTIQIYNFIHQKIFLFSLLNEMRVNVSIQCNFVSSRADKKI